jgi:hypothetical protein
MIGGVHSPVRAMRGFPRWVLAAAVGCQGCAIIALVGENRDAGFDAAAADVPALPDVVAPPDVPALPDVVAPPDVLALPDAGPPAMDVAFVTDVPFVLDGRMLDRPGPSGAGQDVVDADLADVADGARDDVVLLADASATADAGMVMLEDSAAREDAQQVVNDVAGGNACRRDSDCTRDPAGMLCGLMTMRCGTVR